MEWIGGDTSYKGPVRTVPAEGSSGCVSVSPSEEPRSWSRAVFHVSVLVSPVLSPSPDFQRWKLDRQWN